jgi:SAM-dependent methyltransferase
VETIVADTSSRQGQHYDRLVDLYEQHATDRLTLLYRRRFIDEPLLRGIDLSGRSVLEAMSGSGHSTAFLLERGARVTGLDVSERAIELFSEKWPQSVGVLGGILAHGLPPASFDAVVVVGGLHHVHPHVEEAVAEIWNLLKPQGYFCFSEPHTNSVVDTVRRQWYRRDRLFEANEAAIDVAKLKRAFDGKFAFLSERYFGNVAHTLLLNSMALRIPTQLKPFYAVPVIAVETALNPLLGRRLSCSVRCQWQKIA